MLSDTFQQSTVTTNIPSLSPLYRPVCIFGAVLSWASFSLSVMSPSVGVMMLTYGLMGGLGLGLIYLPANVSVGFYFERRRALATGDKTRRSILGYASPIK